MKVRLVLSIELNEAAQESWMENYGVDKSELREDVKRYFGNELSGDDFIDRIGVPFKVSWK